MLLQPEIYRLKLSICSIFRKSLERGHRARTSVMTSVYFWRPKCKSCDTFLPRLKQNDGMHTYAACIGNFFDRIPGIISQARRHLHDTEFEVIERIHRRLGDSLSLVNHLVSRACDASSALNADRQDDFCSLMTAVQSFYEAYSINTSANESLDDRQATVGYLQLETLRSHGRPRFVITGRQIDSLQQRHYTAGEQWQEL